MAYAMPAPVSMGAGNPDVAFYGNALRKLLTDPNSFQTDPGYNFARDEALNGVMRANSKMLGSGNVMTALQDRASGLASQAYDGRVNQLAGLLGQGENYDLGLGRNAIDAQGTADTYALGADANDINRTRAGNDLELGKLNAGNVATRNANDFTIGQGANANNTLRDLIDFNLGSGQNANAAQRNANDFTLGNRSADTNFYDAQTRRGTAQSNSYLNNQAENLDWTKFYYQLYPRQRVAGQP